MKSYKYNGKDKKEMINLALYQLNVDEDQIIIKDIETTSGIFKIKKHEIEIFKKEDIKQYLIDLVKDLLSKLGCTKVEIKSYFKENVLYIKLNTDKNAQLIGNNARRLNRINKFLKLSLSKYDIYNFKLILDIANYKTHQAKKIQYNSYKLAKEVLKTGISVTLDPMNSYQRRLIHTKLANMKGIITESIGEEPNRSVVIKKDN